MKFIKNNKTGFTLAEVLIYTAVLGIVVSGFVAYALSISSIKNKNFVITTVNDSNRQVLDFFYKKIKQATNIIAPANGATSTILILEFVDSSRATTSLIDGIINYRYQNLDLGITNVNVSASDLYFKNLAPVGLPGSVKITYNLDYKYPGSVDFSFGTSAQIAVSLNYDKQYN